MPGGRRGFLKRTGGGLVAAASVAGAQEPGVRAPRPQAPAGPVWYDEGVAVTVPSIRWRLQPESIRSIALDAPQMLVDDYLIENRYDERSRSATVPHVLHMPERLRDPVLEGDAPWEKEKGIYFPSVVFDGRAQLFRMYYTAYHPRVAKPGYPPGQYFTCYAESPDGLRWRKPNLGLHSWGDLRETNILVQGTKEAHNPIVYTDQLEATAGRLRIRHLNTLPVPFLRGHRFLMFYGDVEHYLATSEDGIRWREKQQMILPLRIDAYQSIIYDDDRREFVCFIRNKVIFGDRNKPKEIWGNVRAVSRVASSDLWTLWDMLPMAVMLPDGEDDSRFYRLPAFRYGGVYWGFLHQYADDPARMEVETVFSRNGIDWTHAPGRRRILKTAAYGAWDGGMIESGETTIEVGDEWWLYYTGYRGYHDDPSNRAAIGLVKFRKEGIVSVRAGEQECTLVTRPLVWPGGSLVVNAAAARGSIRARVTDPVRREIPGFGLQECAAFTGDSVRHEFKWQGAEIARLAGQTVRLEFRFRNADLFAFLARQG
jgi:hypothetical protein